MKSTIPVLLALLHACAAEKWALKNCDKFNDGNFLKDSVRDAITIAETAASVMGKNRDNEKVQSMAKLVLGDGDAFDDKFVAARKSLENVARYNKEDYPLLTEFEYFSNEDVLIHCDDSNFEERDGKTYNGPIGLIVENRQWQVVESCFAPFDPENPGMAAFTSPSDGIWSEYTTRFAEWSRGGRQGPPPDPNDFSYPRNVANTMNICPWFLEQMQQGTPRRIDDTYIKKVTSEDFQKGEKPKKPIDALSQTVTGVLLHELTHTNLGGKSVDAVADGGCYGWDCIRNVQRADNADSLSILGICMYLFSKGFWVDEKGVVKKSE